MLIIRTSENLSLNNILVLPSGLRISRGFIQWMSNIPVANVRKELESFFPTALKKKN